MKNLILCAAVALAASALPALAADIAVKAKPAPTPPPSWWEIAYGGALMSDYNFRGISQSDRGIAGTVYVEGRANVLPDVLQLYGGIQAWTTRLPTSPIGEFDFYGGLRATLGPVQFDFGAMYYHYPRESQVFVLPSAGPVGFGFPTTQPGANPLYVPWTVADTDFWEVYGKATWTVNTWLSLGGYLYYADNWLGSGAYGTYGGGMVKLTAPSSWFPTDFGAYLSGEVAHYWLGTTVPLLGSIDLPDYLYWNVGVAFAYKVFTLDLRYHDTDLTRAQCFTITGDLNGLDTGRRPGRSNWCGEAFIAKLSIDTTIK
jgi:hypothetical protein